MAQTGFSVQTQELMKASAAITEKTARYEAEVAKIYSEIANLRIKWKGESSEAFNAQLESYRKDFNQLATDLKGYAEHLKNSASKYDSTDISNAGAAKRL